MGEAMHKQPAGPSCICGPTCANYGHCRIPIHHRAGCPVRQEVTFPDGQWTDHRELLSPREELAAAIDNAERIIGPSAIGGQVVTGVRQSNTAQCYRCEKTRYHDQLVREFDTMRPFCRDRCERPSEVNALLARVGVLRGALYDIRSETLNGFVDRAGLLNPIWQRLAMLGEGIEVYEAAGRCFGCKGFGFRLREGFCDSCYEQRAREGQR